MTNCVLVSLLLVFNRSHSEMGIFEDTWLDDNQIQDMPDAWIAIYKDTRWTESRYH